MSYWKNKALILLQPDGDGEDIPHRDLVSCSRTSKDEDQNTNDEEAQVAQLGQYCSQLQGSTLSTTVNPTTIRKSDWTGCKRDHVC